MKRILKRALQVLGGLVALFVLLFAAVAYSAFGGTSSIQDGESPTPTVRIVKDGFVSVGVVDAGGGKVILVDAGNDPMGKAIFAELSRRGASADAVVAIFLTHGHADHLAACKAFPAASVYAMKSEAALVAGTEGAHGPLTRMVGPKQTGIALTRGLDDGEVVDVLGTKVRAFAVPGHTAGSAAYLVGGVLFLGDSARMTSDGKLIGAAWAFSDDVAKNHASLAALAKRFPPEEESSVVALAPAHTGTGKLSALSAFVP